MSKLYDKCIISREQKNTSWSVSDTTKMTLEADNTDYPAYVYVYTESGPAQCVTLSALDSFTLEMSRNATAGVSGIHPDYTVISDRAYQIYLVASSSEEIEPFLIAIPNIYTLTHDMVLDLDDWEGIPLISKAIGFCYLDGDGEITLIVGKENRFDYYTDDNDLPVLMLQAGNATTITQVSDFNQCVASNSSHFILDYEVYDNTNAPTFSISINGGSITRDFSFSASGRYSGSIEVTTKKDLRYLVGNANTTLSLKVASFEMIN